MQENCSSTIMDGPTCYNSNDLTPESNIQSSPSSSDDSIPKRLNSIDCLINGFFDIIGLDDDDDDSEEFGKDFLSRLEKSESPKLIQETRNKENATPKNTITPTTPKSVISLQDVKMRENKHPNLQSDAPTSVSSLTPKTKKSSMFSLRIGVTRTRSNEGISGVRSLIASKKVEEEPEAKNGELKKPNSNSMPVANIPKRTSPKKSALHQRSSTEGSPTEKNATDNRRWGVSRHRSFDRLQPFYRTESKRLVKVSNSESAKSLSPSHLSKVSVGSLRCIKHAKNEVPRINLSGVSTPASSSCTLSERSKKENDNSIGIDSLLKDYTIIVESSDENLIPE
jgi:hypothetical protein